MAGKTESPFVQRLPEFAKLAESMAINTMVPGHLFKMRQTMVSGGWQWV
jgi:hypothetical protein